MGAPDQLLARTAMYNRMINASTSMVGHDDTEMYERAQEGLTTQGLEWVDLNRLCTGPEASRAVMKTAPPSGRCATRLTLGSSS